MAAGTLFDNHMPRWCRRAMPPESYLDGILVIFVHRDTPGVMAGWQYLRQASGEHRPEWSAVRPASGWQAVGILLPTLSRRPRPRRVLSLDAVMKARIVTLPLRADAGLDGRIKLE